MAINFYEDLTVYNHVYVEGGFYAGTAVDLNYDLKIKGASLLENTLAVSGIVTLSSVANAASDPDKFLCISGSNQVEYRTGAEVLSDIGAASSSSLNNYLPLTGGTLTGGLGVQGNTTLGDATSDTTTINGSTILNKKAASGTNISILQLKTADGSTTWNIGGSNTGYNDFMIWAPDLGAGNYFQINKTSGDAAFASNVTLSNGNALRWTSDDVRIEGTTAGDKIQFYVGNSEILMIWLLQVKYQLQME
jgi:hypothetical protein